MSLTSRGINLYVLYRIIRGVATPFSETKAFKLGIIDEDGNILRRRNELKTDEEKSAYTLFDTFIFNIKKILAKIPGGKSKILTYTAALFLLRENRNIDNVYRMDYDTLSEEIANSVGSGSNFSTDVPRPIDGIVRRSNRVKFGNKDVFIVSPDVYYRLLKSKPKYHRYKNYVGDDEVGLEIKEFAKLNPKKDIIIQNRDNKFMKYLKTNTRWL